MERCRGQPARTPPERLPDWEVPADPRPVGLSGPLCGTAAAPAAAAEVAVEAWAECEPRSGTALEGVVVEVLERVAEELRPRLPLSSAGVLDALTRRPLVPRGAGGAVLDDCPLQRMLRAHNGRVHFLFFWSALGKLVRVADNGSRNEYWLSGELETFRDQVIRRMDSAGGGADTKHALASGLPSGVPGHALAEEVGRAAEMSAQPRFWQSAASVFGQRGPPTWIALEELTQLLLVWLKQAAMWKRAADEVAAVVERNSRFPVYLNIYDVSQEETIQKVNSILAHEYSPFKFGGVFHAGVEVNGLEWSFGFSCSETKPGVACVAPRSNTQHHFRETVHCGYTYHSAHEISRIVSELLEEYPGPDYDLLRRNCCHFADDFCRRLDVGGIPGWVHRLARVGAHVDALVKQAQNVTETVYGPLAAAQQTPTARPRARQDAKARTRAPPPRDEDQNAEMGIWGRPLRA